MTIVVGQLRPDILVIQQWATGLIISVTKDTLDERLLEMVRKMARTTGHPAEAALLAQGMPAGRKYPTATKVLPRDAERALNTPIPGTPPRDELVTVPMPPAEMRVRRPIKGAAPSKPEVAIIWPVRKDGVAPILADDVMRARALATLFFWAREAGQPQLAIVEGWADARAGEITTPRASFTPAGYIAACREAGAPPMPGRHVDYRIDKHGEVVETPRPAARRKA